MVLERLNLGHRVARDRSFGSRVGKIGGSCQPAVGPVALKMRDMRAPVRTNRGSIGFFFRSEETLADKDDAREFTVSGLPVGLQIVGRHRDDWSVLQLAHAFEQATQHGKHRPQLP